MDEERSGEEDDGTSRREGVVGEGGGEYGD
jgi:hypothetical protein